MRKKILIVAYFFPPYSKVGGFRVGKLVKFFNEFGWKITVVTVKEKYYDDILPDQNCCSFVDDSKITVLRTDRIPKISKFNEEGLYWFIPLYFKLHEHLKRCNDYDYMFYTGGPFFHWSIAPLIKKKFNIPYILDFRDPWSWAPYSGAKFMKLVAQIIEPRVVQAAKCIFNVTQEATETYQKHYPDQKGKFFTVPNGFDPDDFGGLKHDLLKDYQGCKVIYAGKFGSFRDPLPFLNSIYRYNKTVDDDEKLLFFHLGIEEDSISAFRESHPDAKENIIPLGFKPYREALSFINSADVCLLITGNHSYEPTTKVYDYIALNKAILCLNNNQESYLYKILKEYTSAVLVANNATDISEVLKLVWDKLKGKSVYANQERFDRRVIFMEVERMLLKD